MVSFAGECDHARARADGELDREHANTAARPGDQDRLTRGRGHGAHLEDLDATVIVESNCFH
jgi:hypothetical protein